MASWSELTVPTESAARRLLGSTLIRTFEGQTLIGKIVETEAYDQTDAASHSFKGRTPRTEVMFGPAGFLYVYFSYGMHYCLNVVTGRPGEGSAVLIRAIEPLEGLEAMRHRRPGHSDNNLTNGPAKLCQAIAVDGSLNGHDLRTNPLILRLQPPVPAEDIMQATRIGISQEIDRKWRFYLRGNASVSHTSA